MVFKNILVIIFLSLTVSGSWAQEVPIVGLWEKIPVSNGVGKLVERTSYVFTSVKLSQPTVFSALRDLGGSVDVLCCLEVHNLKPLQLDVVLNKFRVDVEFGNKLRSIQGLPFMYEAMPAAKSKRNESFQTVMDTELNPDDTSPYSAAVISATFGKAAVLRSPFRAGAHQISVAVKYPKKIYAVIYEFKVDNQVTVFSESVEPH